MKGTKKKQDFQRQLERQLAEKQHQQYMDGVEGGGQHHTRDSGGTVGGARWNEHVVVHQGGARGPPPQVAPKPKNAM